MLTTRRNGWIGVDIGTRCVKLAQVAMRNGHLMVSEARVVVRHVPWNADPTHESEPLASEAEIRSGRSLGTRFSGRRAACVLPMAVCGIHAFRVADGDDRKRRELIRRELTNIGEHDGQDTQFDFWPVDDAKAGNDRPAENVHALTVPTVWSNRLANDVVGAGLSCRTIDGLPLALTRAARLVANDNTRPVGLIDWGFSRATFVVSVNGTTVFVRTLANCGFRRIVESLCSALTIRLEEGEALLSQHGLPDPKTCAIDETQRVIEEVTVQPLAEFTSELGRTLSFLNSHRHHWLPKEITLLGGGATIKHIDSFVAEKVGVPTCCWSMPVSSRTTVRPNRATMCVLGPSIALSGLAWEDE